MGSNDNSSGRQPQHQREETLELPVSGSPSELITPPPTPVKCKPLWWCLFGMPVWCTIASNGNARIARNIAARTVDHNTNGDSNAAAVASATTQFETNTTNNYHCRQELSSPT